MAWSRPSLSKVRDSLERVRRFHAVARASLEARPGPARPHDREIEREAGELGILPELLRKARKFADPDRGDSEAELDRHCDACERAGYPIGTTRVIRLLSIKPKRLRQSLQARAIAARWSKQDPNREIRKRHAPRKLGDRRKRFPTNEADFLTGLLGRTESRRRWHPELTRVPVEGKRKGSLLEELDLPAEPRRRIVRLGRAIAELHDQVAGERKARVPGR